jgi:signal transduction histidine kinase
MDLIGQAVAETRTASYLLHPPMLDELGLAATLAGYTEGFSQRSNVKVILEIASDLGRLPEDHELALFRVVQECLTNIHRHSGSLTATVKLARMSREIKLLVRDSGQGIDRQTITKIDSGLSTGVGIRGMQERLKLLRGHMDVHSDQTGTLIEVTLPIA